MIQVQLLYIKDASSIGKIELRLCNWLQDWISISILILAWFWHYQTQSDFLILNKIRYFLKIRILR